MSRSAAGTSYELLPHVCKPIAIPRDRHDVTLYHVSRKLGKKLSEWPQWEKFVNGFAPEVFNLTHIGRENLSRDASLLRPFYGAISNERKQRLTANVSTGKRELIDSPQDLQRFENDVATKRALQDPFIAHAERELEETLPELLRLK